MRKAASILRGKLTQGSRKRFCPAGKPKGTQRRHGEFNECSELVPQTQAGRPMHASKKHTLLCSGGEATGKYLITGDLV